MDAIVVQAFSHAKMHAGFDLVVTRGFILCMMPLISRGDVRSICFAAPGTDAGTPAWITSGSIFSHDDFAPRQS